jgi:uncharacterized protein YegL
MGALALITGCDRGEQPAPTSVKATTVRIVHGPELRAHLSAMKEQYYNLYPALSDGSRLAIELISEIGSVAARKIASAEIKAEAWIAASTSQVNYANTTLRGLGAKQIDCIPLFSSPIVIATRPENREYFNTTGQRFSWRELFESKLSKTAKDTDAGYLVYSHASPEGSVTGLDGLLQLTRLASPRHDGVTIESLESDATLKNLERFESVVSNYSLSEAYLLERTARASTKRIRFTITSEQQLSLYNAQRQPEAPPLTGLYPSEGSMWQDYQICTSDADWVTPAHRAALRLLTQLLTSPAGQEGAKSRGFRPTRDVEVANHPLSSDFGIDIEEPRTSLPPFDGATVDYLLKLWPELKRPAAVAFVLDNSGSMEGDPLRESKEQLRNIIARLSPRDMKALVSFSTTPRIEAPFTASSGAIIQSLDRLSALGGSAVYEGIRTAIELMSSSELRPYRKSIFVVTDGEDKNSELSLQALLDLINTKFAQHDINLVVIGVAREGVDFSDLEKVVRAANGLFRAAPLDKLPTIFHEAHKNI